VRRTARRGPLQHPRGFKSLMIAGNPYRLQRIVGCGSHVSRTSLASYSKPGTMQGENCRSVSDAEGVMNGLLKGALAVGGGRRGGLATDPGAWAQAEVRAVGTVSFQRLPEPVLILGVRVAGYTAATTLCKFTRYRDDIGVMHISRENYFTFWPMLPGVVSSYIRHKERRAALEASPDPSRGQLPEGRLRRHRPREAVR
jgi:hypothetical protein